MCPCICQIWPEVAVDLKTDAEGRGAYMGKLLKTSAGPLTAKTLKGTPIS